MIDNNHTTQKAIRKFIETWKNRGYEKGDTQSFWYQLLNDIFKIETPASYIYFEKNLGNTFSDGYIPKTKVIIEQKSLGIDLTKKEKQSDGTMLTPYEQAKRYSEKLRYSQRARWIVISNFQTFHIYDMENNPDEPTIINLLDLEKDYFLLEFLVLDIDSILQKEKELSVQAGELISDLYDSLLKEYINPQDLNSVRSLNILCVRLVFCLFAEDSELFGNGHGNFYKYLVGFKPTQMREALIRLFKNLATPYDKRDPYATDLNKFPYVNGGLFEDNNNIEIPQFTEEIVDILLEKCSRGFNWRNISPTIFGAVVEDTMNPETRDKDCPHYTTVQNIHKVIDPLFLNNLNNRLRNILLCKNAEGQIKLLKNFHIEISSLSFLDPACGSGNFLTETYLSLRKLENQILFHLSKHNALNNYASPIKVSIENFHGIEVNDFAVSVAKAALWIAEAQMMKESQLLFDSDFTFFPLKSNTFIHECNALVCDWNTILPASQTSYIIGNPPFIGKKNLNNAQRTELLNIAKRYIPKRSGNLDYVAAWYLKAAQYMQNTNIKAAFVSTVNVTRGEQVNILWPVLYNKFNINILFAHKPFLWTSEARQKVQVHCTIIGFSCFNGESNKRIYNENGESEITHNITPYLRSGDVHFIKSRKKPICDEAPIQKIGNKPIDHGYYIFSKDEMLSFISEEPKSKKYLKKFVGGEEWINNKDRYILWLLDCSPAELRKMPLCLDRVEKVRNFRASLGDQSSALADTPTHPHVLNIPNSDFIVIPEVTSEKRKYIPMNFVRIKENGNTLYSNLVKIIAPATLYHFGILQSIVHIIWTKAFCGYKDRRIRYSTEVVYNNFPWPIVSEKLRTKIEEAAGNILTIRSKYFDSTIADLYDDIAMPKDLRVAHNSLDKLVYEAYGMSAKTSEEDILAHLCDLYDTISSK